MSDCYGLDKARFDSLMSKIQEKKYDQVDTFLNNNKDKLKKNPEYYVILLNYVLSKGDQSSLVVAKGTPKQDDFSLKDLESNETVGSLGQRGGYDEDLIVNGINRTQKALSFFNSRLDIHFGIIIIAETIQRWDIVGTQLETILKTSKEINNKWIWGTVNSMEGEPEEFMIQNVLTKTALLFQAETKEADEALEKVSLAMIKYYPKKIYGYANLGTLYMVINKNSQAEKYYKKALEIDPNDNIVLENLEKLQKQKKKENE